jgi:Mg2+/Co2+ transporter CorC
MPPRAQFTVIEVSDNVLQIRDDGPWDRYPTVTNDVEAVVADLHAKCLLGRRRLLYADSNGDVDEIRHDGAGRFLGFAPGPR